MCVAVPMEVLEIFPNNKIKVALSGNEMLCDSTLITPQVGDFVLIHAGCALEVMQSDTAKEVLELFSEAFDGS